MPPRMIPDIDPSKIGNQGERAMYKALRRGLPDDWTVRYSFGYCIKAGTKLQDGEADFVLSAPYRGMLYLEVKASAGYSCVEGRWRRHGRGEGDGKEMPSPLEQAKRSKHRLREHFARLLGHDSKEGLAGIHGHAAVFPQGRLRGSAPSSHDRSLVLDADDLPRLHDRLCLLFEEWGSRLAPSEYPPELHERVSALLAEDARIIPLEHLDADEDEARIQAITVGQYDGLKAIMASERVLVEGVAGSGKTMIAHWAAKEMAQKGIPTRFLCFNRSLAEWLQSRDGGAGVQTSTFHHFCRESIEAAGARFEEYPGENQQEDFWTKTVPKRFLRAVKAKGAVPRPGALFVDEAQDFLPDWWRPLLELAGRDGRMYIFHDPDQSGLYTGAESAVPSKGFFRCRLEENCRNTREIMAYCERAAGKPIAPHRLSPLGVAPEILPPQPDAAERARLVERIVAMLLAQGFHPRRIALLSPWAAGRGRSCLDHIDAIADLPLVEVRDGLAQWMAGEGIGRSTIKAFKGLEADCVVVADVPALEESHAYGRTDWYVAATRAHHRLVLAPMGVEAAADLAGAVQPDTA